MDTLTESFSKSLGALSSVSTGEYKPTHKKCTDNRFLPRGYPRRAAIKNVDWSEADDAYAPVNFTAQVVLEAEGWPDPKSLTEEFMSELSRRKSHALGYETELHNFMPKAQGGVSDLSARLPRNPIGRTGISGRGLLGKYGPNYAADPLVTKLDPTTGKLQMIAIERRDNGTWAIPGGMVDAGESVSRTLQREFTEEALAGEGDVGMNPVIAEVFERGGTLVFKGYVDDPRNTDNAWMETTCVHYHIEDPAVIAVFDQTMKAGDDAAAVKWLDIDAENEHFKNLYASHKELVIRALLMNPVKFSGFSLDLAKDAKMSIE